MPVRAEDLIDRQTDRQTDSSFAHLTSQHFENKLVINNSMYNNAIVFKLRLASYNLCRIWPLRDAWDLSLQTLELEGKKRRGREAEEECCSLDARRRNNLGSTVRSRSQSVETKSDPNP